MKRCNVRARIAMLWETPNGLDNHAHEIAILKEHPA